MGKLSEEVRALLDGLPAATALTSDTGGYVYVPEWEKFAILRARELSR